jgi:CRISPR-associated endonuclease/helicase Cas3
MDKKYYAHTLEGKPPSDWQPLEEHLKNVAEMTRLFADAFGAGDWGYLAGLRHVFGERHSLNFKKYFKTTEGRIIHEIYCKT